MSGSRISELTLATLPLAGTEEVPLRVGASNRRTPLSRIFAAARSVPIAQEADGTSVGGNTRGNFATDLQRARTEPTQVASGPDSVIAGGRENTADSERATVGGGVANRAGGNGSTIAGGWLNEAMGGRSWIPGGDGATTRSQRGMGAWSTQPFAARGDAQSSERVLTAISTSATPVRLTTDRNAPGSTNTANLPDNGVYRLKLLIVARQHAGSAGTVGDCASWNVEVLIKRGASAADTVFVGGQTTTNAPAIANVASGATISPSMRDTAASAWTIAVSADTTNGGLAISATGEANKTIRWVARIIGVETVSV